MMIESNRRSPFKTLIKSPLTGTLAFFGIFVAMMCVCLFIISVISTFVPQDSRAYPLIASIVQSVVAFIGTAWLSARCVSLHPVRFLEISTNINWRAILGVVIIYILSLPLMNQLIWWNQQIHLPESLSAVEDVLRSWEDSNGGIAQQMINSPSVVNMIICVLVMGVLTGFSEEVLFRGALQRIMALKGHYIMAIFLSAFIFSALHFQFFGFIPRMLLGIWFGYLIYSTGSIWTSTFAHALNNSIVVLGGWLSARGITDFVNDESGVVTDGIPWLAISSGVAVAIFLIFFRGWFFNKQVADKVA